MLTSRKSLTFLYSALMFSFLWISAQENPEFKNILGKLATYKNINQPEKVYLHTDKDFYTNGETIWFKTYLLNGITHTLSDKSKVIYVELVDSKESVIAQRKLFVGEDGANGDIGIPNEIIEGSYLLRAYTKYMLNDENPMVFQKEIPIWRQQSNSYDTSKNVSQEKMKAENFPETEPAMLKEAKPIVQFFPEGGDLVAGMEGVLGLKITDASGNPLALKGKIFNQDSVLQTTFRSYEIGLGLASFRVEPSTNYYLQIENNNKLEKYSIPAPLLKGYTLHVQNMGEYLKINVATNIANGLQGALLVGHIRGDVVLKRSLKSNGEDFYKIKLLTSKLQDGIAHFTLFTPNGEPVCERLTFVENPENDLKLSVDTHKSNYGFREKVNIDLALVDDNEKPIDGDLSMTVVTQKGIQKEAENLKSWLLLNSDLGRTITNPNFFFQEELEGRKFLLDLLMLTHGWRRFTWQSILDGRVSKELEFPPEKGIMINGATTGFYKRNQPKQTLATLNIIGEKFIQEKDSTNTQGKFSFGPFIFQDSISTFINAHAIPETKKRRDKVSIHLDPSFSNIKLTNSKNRQIDKKTTTYAAPYLRKAQQKKIADVAYNSRLIKLNEVVVKSPKKTREEIITEELNSRTLYGEAQNRLIVDSIPSGQTGSVLDLVRRVPGVRVFGDYPNQSAQIRGAGTVYDSGAPLYLLNGMPVSSAIIQSMSAFDVLFIDVLKGPEAAIYGIQGANGVIAIHTRRGDDFPELPKRYPGIANFTIPGFYKTREFYSPNYAVAESKHQTPDYRTTLHWEPKIENKDGAEIQFYTGDSEGNYLIRVEGMTFDGRPVTGYQSINVVDEGSLEILNDSNQLNGRFCSGSELP